MTETIAVRNEYQEWASRAIKLAGDVQRLFLPKSSLALSR